MVLQVVPGFLGEVPSSACPLRSSATTPAREKPLIVQGVGTHPPSRRDKTVGYAASVSNTTVEYLRITMTDVLVPSMNTGGDCVSGRPVDTLTLTFGKISVQYTRQSSTGAGLSVNFNWDFGANRGF
jgi:hypothetical protein